MPSDAPMHPADGVKDPGLPFSGMRTNRGLPMPFTMPSLTVTERSGSVCLQLGGVARGEGTTLQEAADDLIRRLLALAIAFRSSGFKVPGELGPDFETMDLLYELGEIAAGGGDIRARVFS